MEFDIAIKEIDVGVIGVRMRSQAFEDIMMRLHGFLNDNMQTVLFGETASGRHE
jgi:hypothetical protein